jgi:hypothetical protein
MPRTTRTAAFGPEYEQLLLLAFESQGEKWFQFNSASVALSMKRKVYAYWKALRTENLRPDLVEKSNLLSLRVEGGSLVVFRREDAWDAKALRASMGLEKGFADALSSGVLVAKSPTDELVERLYKLRGETEKP